MQILIITSDKNLQIQIKNFVLKHFGETSKLSYATDIHDAANKIIYNNPEFILANSIIAGHNILKLVDKLPANSNRNYFIINIDERNAIKAIRLGVRGMFNFETDQNKLVEALVKQSEKTSIKKLEDKLKKLTNKDPVSKSLIVQTISGFKEIKFCNLHFVEYKNNKIHFQTKKRVFESKHELIMVTNNLPYKTFSVVTPNLIINSANVIRIKPKSNGCLVVFNNEICKHIPNMGLDTLFRIIKETQVIQ